MLATKFLQETLGKVLIESSRFSGELYQQRSNLLRCYDSLLDGASDFDKISTEKSLDFFYAKPVFWENLSVERQKNYTIAAVDGSQILSDDLDVSTPPFLLINIGLIQTNYPKQEVVHYKTFPSLVFKQHANANLARDTALYRTEKEFIIARDTLHTMQEDNVLLIDGGLLQWHLTESKNEQKDAVLSQIITTFEEASQQNVHLLGYISGTNACDVVGSMRLYHCKEQMHCNNCLDEFCMLVKQMKDENLFLEILPIDKTTDWMVSPIFQSRAPMINDYYGQDIYFFYLYHQFEFARVECTKHSLNSLEYLIGVLLDQLEKGHGYPLVLKEAHELAVLKQKDKMVLEQLLIQQKNELSLYHGPRAKNLAKKFNYI